MLMNDYVKCLEREELVKKRTIEATKKIRDYVTAEFYTVIPSNDALLLEVKIFKPIGKIEYAIKLIYVAQRKDPITIDHLIELQNKFKCRASFPEISTTQKKSINFHYEIILYNPVI